MLLSAHLNFSRLPWNIWPKMPTIKSLLEQRRRQFWTGPTRWNPCKKVRVKRSLNVCIWIMLPSTDSGDMRSSPSVASGIFHNEYLQSNSLIIMNKLYNKLYYHGWFGDSFETTDVSCLDKGTSCFVYWRSSTKQVEYRAIASWRHLVYFEFRAKEYSWNWIIPAQSLKIWSQHWGRRSLFPHMPLLFCVSNTFSGETVLVYVHGKNPIAQYSLLPFLRLTLFAVHLYSKSYSQYGMTTLSNRTDGWKDGQRYV